MKKLTLGLGAIAALALTTAALAVPAGADSAPSVRMFCTTGPIRCLAALRKSLPEEELDAALAAGRAMDWEQAIAYALEEADG